MDVGYLAAILSYTGINIILTLGLYVIVVSGQWSMAHAAVAGIAAYTTGYLTTRVGLPYVIGIIMGTLMAGAVGFIISYILRKISGIYFAIASFSCGMLISILITNTDFLGGALGLYGIPIKSSPLLILISGVFIIYIVYALDNSRMGDAFRAVGDDEVAAGAVGINTDRVRQFSFLIGSLIAGYGGALFAHYLGIIEPNHLGSSRAMELFLFLALGGRYNLWGAVLGAFLVSMLPEMLRFSETQRFILFGIILVVIMTRRPRGVIPRFPYNPLKTSFSHSLARRFFLPGKS